MKKMLTIREMHIRTTLRCSIVMSSQQGYLLETKDCEYWPGYKRKESLCTPGWNANQKFLLIKLADILRTLASECLCLAPTQEVFLVIITQNLSFSVLYFPPGLSLCMCTLHLLIMFHSPWMLFCPSLFFSFRLSVNVFSSPNILPLLIQQTHQKLSSFVTFFSFLVVYKNFISVLTLSTYT